MPSQLQDVPICLKDQTLPGSESVRHFYIESLWEILSPNLGSLRVYLISTQLDLRRNPLQISIVLFLCSFKLSGVLSYNCSPLGLPRQLHFSSSGGTTVLCLQVSLPPCIVAEKITAGSKLGLLQDTLHLLSIFQGLFYFVV